MKKSWWKKPSFIIDFAQLIVIMGVAVALALDMADVWTNVPWLSDNLPSLTFIAVCILIISTFVERNFQIKNFTEQVNYKLDMLSNSHSSGIKLAGRDSFSVPFDVRIKNAEKVDILGISNVGILSLHSGFIAERAKTGCRFRFILLNPKHSYVTKMRRKWKSIDVDRSTELLESIQKSTNSSVEYRYIDELPHFSMLLIDSSKPHGEIQVELHVHDIPLNDRPHFILTQSLDKKWYDFFHNQFELIWNRDKTENSVNSSHLYN